MTPHNEHPLVVTIVACRVLSNEIGVTLA